jgi:hypothetical protein
MKVEGSSRKPVGGSADPGFVRPTASSDDDRVSPGVQERASVDRNPLVGIAVRVLAPFPDVSVRVVEAEGVRHQRRDRFGSFRMAGDTVVPAIPHVPRPVAGHGARRAVFAFVQTSQRVAERKPRFGSRPAGVLPFRLGREAERSLPQRAEGGHEILRFCPRDVVDRVVVANALVSRRVVSRQSPPLGLSHLGLSEVEVVVDRDGVDGSLVAVASALPPDGEGLASISIVPASECRNGTKRNWKIQMNRVTRCYSKSYYL